MIVTFCIIGYLLLAVATLRAMLFYDKHSRRHNELISDIRKDRVFAGLVALVWPMSALIGLIGLLLVILGKLGGVSR